MPLNELAILVVLAASAVGFYGVFSESRWLVGMGHHVAFFPLFVAPVRILHTITTAASPPSPISLPPPLDPLHPKFMELNAITTLILARVKTGKWPISEGNKPRALNADGYAGKFCPAGFGFASVK